MGSVPDVPAEARGYLRHMANRWLRGLLLRPFNERNQMRTDRTIAVLAAGAAVVAVAVAVAAPASSATKVARASARVVNGRT